MAFHPRGAGNSCGDANGRAARDGRRIADIAKAGVVGAVLGTICSVALVYWFGRDGVVAALIAVAAASLLATWWYVVASHSVWNR